MKFYKVIAVSTLIYGSEPWGEKSAEVKCMRYVKGCTKADKIRNDTIRLD